MRFVKAALLAVVMYVVTWVSGTVLLVLIFGTEMDSMQADLAITLLLLLSAVVAIGVFVAGVRGTSQS